MRIDDRLAAWGRRTRTSGIEPPEVPVDRLGARRRWTVVAVPLVAAACVAAVAFGAELAGGRAEPMGTSASATRPYTFHGLTLDVPRSWPLNATNCGVPLKNTVVPAPDGKLCEIPNPPHVSVVTFALYPRSYVNGKVKVTDPTKTTVTMDGRRITKITGTSAGQAGSLSVARGDPIVVFLAPSLGVSATIQSPDRGLVDRIAATARIVRTDANGCLARRTDLRTLPTGRPPARPGADTKLIPGHPTHVAVCNYDWGGLEQSAAPTGAERAKLLRILNGLPTGLSIAPPKTYLASFVCTREREHPNGYTVVATYGQGPPVTVWVRLGTCKLLGASNGTHTGQRGHAPGPLMSVMARLVGGNGMGVPGNVKPAPRHYH